MTLAMPRLTVCVSFTAMLAILFACKAKPQPGGTCPTHGQWTCRDDQSVLYCENGMYIELACRGPRGCSKTTTGGSACDDSLAEEGDVCLKMPNHACSVDHKKALVCKDDHWALWFPCKGPDGCVLEAKTVTCDTTVADVNDACQTAGAGACGSDKKWLLVCAEGKFSRVNSCRGPRGCHLEDKLAYCDESLALENDACDTPDERTCSVDGKSQLICKSQKYAKEKDCKRPCTFSSHREPPRCDY